MATNKEKAAWLKQTLDILAENTQGEFGYDTCDEQGKLRILEELFSSGLIN